MTISLSDNTPRISYTVNEGATQTAFTVPFEFFAEADLNFYVDGTKKTLTTHYTISGGNGSTGTINTTSGNTVTGASGGSTVVITRSIALSRTTDFPVSGSFSIDTLNTELDRFVAIQADNDDTIDRALHLADSDSAVSMELPLVAVRKGTVLGFNASTGAAEVGPTIANVNSLSAITANINTTAGIAANVTTVAGIASNVTTVAGIASNVTSVAGVASLITSDFVSDLNTLATSDIVTDLNILATSDVVSDLNTLATSDIVSDLNKLATDDIVSDLNTLATTDIVNDLNTLATSDIVTDLNLLATSAIVEDLSLLATSDVIADMASLAGSGGSPNITALTASGDITGSTFAATGDTAAGDNASIGYTSAEGLILTGQGSTNDVTIKNDADQDVIEIPTGTTNVTVAGTLGVGGALTANAGVVVDNITIDGNEIDVSSGDLTLDVAGDLIFDSDAPNWRMKDNGTSILEIGSISSGPSFYSAVSDADMHFRGNDGGSSFTALTLDMSEAGAATFNNSVTATGGAFVKASSGATATSGTVLTVEDDDNAELSILGGSSSLLAINFGHSGDNDEGKITFNTTSGSEELELVSSKNIKLTASGGTTNINSTTNAPLILKSTSGTGGYTEYQLGASGANIGYIGSGEELASGSAANLTLRAQNQLVFASGGGTERMRLTNTGLGIGNTSPDRTLSLKHASQAEIGFKTGSVSNGALIYYNDNENLLLLRAQENNDSISFQTGGTSERARLDQDGKLLIGTTSALGDGLSLMPRYSDSSTTSQIRWNRANGTGVGEVAVFQNNSSSVGSISHNNSSTSYNTSSDYRLKENVTYSWDATTRLKQLKPARFNWIADDTNTLVDGFLAHEVSSVIPEAIVGSKDATENITNVVLKADGSVLAEGITEAQWTAGKADGIYENNTTWVASKTIPKYQQIDQAKLVPLLCKTIIELEARITALEG